MKSNADNLFLDYLGGSSFRVEKHQSGSHDQLTHGNWAGGAGTTVMPKSLRERIESLAGKRPAATVYDDGYIKGEREREVTYESDLDRRIQQAVMTRDRLTREMEDAPTSFVHDVRAIMAESAMNQQGYIDGATQAKRMYRRQFPTLTEYLTGFPSGKFASRAISKHLAGSHDQSTHGNWADAIPREALQGSGQDLVDRLAKEGILTYGDGKAPVYRTETVYLEEGEEAPKDKSVGMYSNGRRYYLDTVLVEDGENDIADAGRRDVGDRRRFIQAAIAAGADEAELNAKAKKELISANSKLLERFFLKEADAQKLGQRQRKYYARAMRERVHNLAASREQQFIYDIIKEYSDKPEFMRGFDFDGSGNESEYREDAAARSKELRDLKATEKALPNILNSSRPTVAIHADAFLQVLEDGRFKPQYETGESKGLYKPAYRRMREFGMLGVPQETPSKQRPIYGFITTQETGTSPHTQDYNQYLFNINSRGVSQYGDVRVTFKPELAERSTYTLNDSLNGGSLGRPLRDKHTVSSMAEAGLYENISIGSHGGKLRDSYIEAQIHGGVSVKDIDTIYINAEGYARDALKADTTRIKNILREKKLDIPVKIITAEDKVEVTKTFKKEIADAEVLYRRSDGSEVLYAGTQNDELMGRVRDRYGRVYPKRSVGAIIARGYWDVVLEVPDEMEKHQSGTHDQQSHGNWADGSDKYNALLQDLGYTQDSDIEGIRAGDIKAYAQTFNEFVDTDMTDITSYQQDGYRLINPYLRGTELDEDDYETINRRYLFSNSDEVSTEVVDLVRSNEVIQSEFQRWAQMNDLQLGAAMRAKEYKELLAQAIDEMDLRDVAVTIATDAKYIPKGFKKSIEQIDELIDKAPPVMGKTELFRVYNADALAGLEEGSVIRDKAFLSTTSRDLTSPNSQDLVNLLDSVTAYDGVTSRVTAVIEPNKKGDGKGFSFPHAEAAQTFFKTGDFNWVDLTVTEREVLLPRNTSLQFKGYGTRNDRRVAIFQRVD